MNERTGAIPGLAIAFPLEGTPRIVGTGGADADRALLQRIVVCLDDEWRDLLLRAAELASRDDVRAGA
jgi:hypothetical protein